ncbi:unnamed protein product [Dovyalis caffra]|uniref:Uncharacterized protein n=1 Tax=Dovyalis caffra TaxID=77055 RepID=A0AAV1RIV9_9ROSI|nr:unnamed protein product [Dovyalis caffra]
MTSALFLASALAFLALSAINFAQARTLPDRFGLKVATAIASRRPPYLVRSSKSKESTNNYEKYLTSPPPTPGYDQGTMSSPPEPAQPKGQLEIDSPCSTEESPCFSNSCISMITDSGRPISAYSPPKPATPIVPVFHPNSPPRKCLVSARVPDDLLILEQVESRYSTEESPCISDACISMITETGRPISAYSPPKPATPIVPVLDPKSPPRQYIHSSS